MVLRASPCFVVAALLWVPSSGFADEPLLEGLAPWSHGVQLKPGNSTPADLKAVRDAGFSYFRRGFYWSQVEPVKSKYSFEAYDKLLDEAAKLDLGVVAVLYGTNKLYEKQGAGGFQSQAEREGFAAFAAALADRYKGRKVVWEIWNEPNTQTFWHKGKGNSKEFAKEYSDLVNTVAPAMVKADPKVVVAAGALSNYWEPAYQWAEYCFQNGVLKSGIRAWSVHPYGVKTPEEHAEGHTRIRELLKKYGAPDLAIINSERGFSVKQTNEGWSGGSQDKALEFQSWHLVRQYMVDRMSGVPLTVWYEWGGDEFGFKDAGKFRPVHAASKVLSAQMAGYRYAERLETESPLDYLLVFTNKAGDRKIVAWTAPPKGGVPDRVEAHPVAVDVPEASAVVDVYGQSVPAQFKGGKLTLHASGSPLYVTVSRGK